MNEETRTIPPEVQRVPDVQVIATGAEHACQRYLNNYQVANAEAFTSAADDLQTIKTYQKNLEEQRKAIVDPMNAAKNAVQNFFNPIAARLGEAEAAVKQGISDYTKEQKRIADEAARVEREKAEREAERLREEARKADEAAAEKERKRLAAEQAKVDERARVEQERIAAEAAAAKTEEDKRRVAEQEAAAQRRADEEKERLHQERLQAEADERERTARAENLLERADVVTTAPVANTVPKVSGISTRKKWTFEILDITKLPAEYLKPNDTAIGGVVRALKDKTNIPGIRVYTEDVVSARAK